MSDVNESQDEKKSCEKFEANDQLSILDDTTCMNNKKTGQRQRYKIRDKGGDYLIEINGNVLNVYGEGAVRFIDRPWNTTKAKEVTTVKFNFLDFNFVSLILGRIKNRFPKSENFSFLDTNIYCLGQINALADIQGITSLTIEKKGNPITEKVWKSYAIYRLSHWGLKIINDTQITQDEIIASDQEFKGLSDLVIQCLPDNLLSPLLERLQLGQNSQRPREWLDLADPSLKTVVAKEALQWRKNKQETQALREKGKATLQALASSTLSTVVKLRLLNRDWTKILREIVRDTLVDYTHIDAYMKQCMSELINVN